jgi:hypothetical protein
MEEPKTITLKYPVKAIAANGKETLITSVTIKRAKAKDLRGLPPGAFADNPSVAAIAVYCGISFESAEDLDFEDLMVIMKEMPSLMPGFSGTGERSSGESPESTTSLQT